MVNTYLWNFLIFSGFSLTIVYIFASYFILKFVYERYKKRERPLSWLGLVVSILVIGAANLSEASYHAYNALTGSIFGEPYILFDSQVSRSLLFFSLFFKYYAAMLLILFALLLARETRKPMK
ncbi:MAG: hypothetical protein HY051_05780 [Candidatus Aenigmarchaeota archaeon]|nr:hypothetical protein [Candidatus Aenigmarchaeota archaeon]